MKPTICFNCKHIIKLESEFSPRAEVWYNLVCEAFPTEELDVVTGRMQKVFNFCRDVNNGSCPKYEEKGK